MPGWPSGCAYPPSVAIHINTNAWIHMQQRPGHIQESTEIEYVLHGFNKTRKTCVWIFKKKKKKFIVKDGLLAIDE